MEIVMIKNIFTIIGFVTGCVFWGFDSSVHYFVYSEPEFELIPKDTNELWMRFVIVVLILLFGVFADFFSKKLVVKQKRLEAMNIYSSMLGATNLIIHNLLHQMEIFKSEALSSKDFKQEYIKYYDNAFFMATDLLEKLSNVENITNENIRASVVPKNKGVSSNKANSADAKKRG